jgi:ADP-ribosyl-[dinitrogen reductase] hydrolase
MHAAMAVSCMAHYVLHGLGPKSDMPGFLAEHVPGNWTDPWQGEVGSRGWMSVRAALTSLLKSDSLSRLLKSCVAWSGDTDTVAAIALSVGAHSMEMEKDLPVKLFNDLENRQFGRDYLLELDRRLLGIVERSGG